MSAVQQERHGLAIAGWLFGLFTLSVIIPFLCAFCVTGVAQAASGSGTFGEAGEGAGQFHEPTGVAVDNCRTGLGEACTPLDDPSVGDAYIADLENNRVDKFGPNGEFLLAWGWGVADGKEKLETCGPEAATARCFPGIAGGGAGELSAGFSAGVAVDSAPGASQGDVYVEDAGNHRIEKFTPSGEFRVAWGEGVANGKEEGERCGPEAGTSTCRSGVEPAVAGEGEGPGEFEHMPSNAIAVDSSGNVFVGTVSRVQEFSAAGVFVREVKLAGAGFITSLAVNESHDLYLMGSELSPGVHEYDEAGAELLEPRDPLGSPDAIALGPSGELFVDDQGLGRIFEFEAAGEGKEIASLPRPTQRTATGLAFADASGDLYVEEPGAVHVVPGPVPGPLIETEEVTPEPLGAATVRASIDPENAKTTYHLDYGLEGSPETETEPATLTSEGFAPEAVEFALTGLKPGGSYHFHVVASNANGTAQGQPVIFRELPALRIEGESSTEVTATSAQLNAQIDPLDSQTEYHFEYGTTTAYEDGSVPVPDASAGSGDALVPVGVELKDLSPGAVYHYRVVVHNDLGEEVGVDHTFTTQSGSAPSGLIDGRMWEMVSPPDKHGASLEMSTVEAGLLQASQDGSRISYFAEGPITSQTSGTRSFAYSQLLSTRGAGGWSTEDITTPEESVQGLISGGGLTEYKQFSSDLSSALVEPQGATPLSRPLSAAESGHQERTPYLRQDSGGAAGQYLPLLTRANVVPGAKFGGKEEEPRSEEQPGVGGAGFEEGTQFVAGTPDLSHIVLSAPLVLTDEFNEAFTDEAKSTSLYEWSAGKPPGEQLQLVSFLPDGHPAAEDGQASSLGNQDNGVRNAISSDGDRVVFESAGENGEHRHLYLRDLSVGKTVQLDAIQPGVASPGLEKPTFVDATPDGSKVFFLDRERLTEDANAAEGAPDLYMCEVTVAAGELTCALKDLTVPLHASEHAAVLGPDLGVDESGTYIYFVASGRLTPDASQGAPNLYVEDTQSAEIRLVATLGSDAPDWRQSGEVEEEFKGQTARVSADGRFLSFMSRQSLTGYDNEDATSRAPGERVDEEVFLYHAPEAQNLAAEPGTLTCVSCNPTGARPHGVLDPPLAGGFELALLVDGPGTWAGSWLAGSLPSWPKIDNRHALYEPRNLDNDGRLFFDSADSLVPQDVNGKEDVYEYEPEGVGGCGLSTGCVGLISSGSSSEESAFVDAGGVGPAGSEGEDVFFMTSAQLATQDSDGALDIYDAHVCSSVAPCPSGVTDVPPACTTTDSCRAAPAPQPDVFGPPASATLTGPGNPPPPAAASPAKKPKTAAQERAEKLAHALGICRKKHNKSKRTACERNARRAYGAHAAKKSKTNKKAHGRRNG
jgi:hypothetical protein